MHDPNTELSSLFSTHLTSENTLNILFYQNSEHSTSPELSQKIAICSHNIKRDFPGIVIDVVPSYISLLIYYDFTCMPNATFVEAITKTLRLSLSQAQPELLTKNIEIPVYYSKKTGPDLHFLAQAKKLPIETLIRLHSERTYTVYAMGFAPGFAYLGFVDGSLASARLASPRKKVPKGSVGIADRQTGIYPCDSPGGWNIIGKTPLDIFDNLQSLSKKCVFQVGDSIKFKPIDEQEFLSLGGTLKC